MESSNRQPLIPHSSSSAFRQGASDFVQRYLHHPAPKVWMSWEEHGNDEHDDDGPIIEHRFDWRNTTRRFLTSRWGHYIILFLVSVDVACIFADFLIKLNTCELKQKHKRVDPGWKTAEEALSLVSLVFSCLFMLELIAATLSFGLSYFSSTFHIFDSLVIVGAFVIDVALKGVLEEIGSIVVVLRLWRVFKIIEELSAAAADSLEKCEDQIEELRRENDHLKRRLRLDLEAAEGGADDED